MKEMRLETTSSIFIQVRNKFHANADGDGYGGHAG